MSYAQVLEDERDLCIMLGVCWTLPLSYLMNLVPEFRRQYRTKIVFDFGKGLITQPISDQEFESCRLLVHTSPTDRGWGSDPAYRDLLGRFPKTAPRIGFPIPIAPALWPLLSLTERRNDPGPYALRGVHQMHYPYGVHYPCAGIIGTSASSGPDGLGVYYSFGDVYVLGKIRAGVPKRQIIEDYLALDVANEVDVDGILAQNHDFSLSQERIADIKLADVVMERFRTHNLYQTVNHPTNLLSIMIADQALALLGYPPVPGYAQQALSELLPGAVPPIHPSIARHFGLTYADGGTRYKIDGVRNLTFEEYLDQYIDFVSAPATEEDFEAGRALLRKMTA